MLLVACTALPDSTDDGDDGVRASCDVKAETVAGTNARSTVDAARSRATADSAFRRCNLVLGIIYGCYSLPLGGDGSIRPFRS